MTMKQIERLVVAVDIRSWLLHPNPTSLALHLQQTVRHFLKNASPFCRWGFKLFDSSMSPFSSRCKINKLLGSWACKTRFDSVLPGGDNSPTLPEVLSQFCSALNCLQTELQKIFPYSQSEDSIAPSNGSSLALSLQELVVDCIWDPLLPSLEDNSTVINTSSPIQSNTNLVIMFSTFPCTSSEIAQFVGIQSMNPTVSDLQSKFSSTFKKVRDSFLANRIHLSWIHIPMNVSTIDPNKDMVCDKGLYHRSQLSLLLEQFGWSFSSLDVLMAGLRMLPFSILWRGIAHPWHNYLTRYPLCTQKLYIQVKDINDKPMKTSLCKMEFISLGGKQLESFTCRSHFQISYTIPRKMFDCARHHVLYQIVVRPHVVEKSKPDNFEDMLGNENDRNFLGDYVLKHLHQEGVVFEPGKPAWQILLSFLAREERVAIIDVDNTTFKNIAIIEPLTIHIAAVTVFDKSEIHKLVGCIPKEDGIHPGKKQCLLNDGEESKPESELTSVLSVDHASQISLDRSTSRNRDRSLLKRKPLLRLDSSSHQDTNVQSLNTTRSGRKRSRSEKSEVIIASPKVASLEELYMKTSKRSKILKGLSCWMKQSKQSSHFLISDHVTTPDGGCSKLDTDNDLSNLQPDETCLKKSDESQPDITLSNTSDAGKCKDFMECHTLADTVMQDVDFLLEDSKSRMPDEEQIAKETISVEPMSLDDANAYLESLEQKICDCLSSEIDLYCFSQRMVVDIHNALSSVLSTEMDPMRSSSSTVQVVDKMKDTLLRPPKKLASKYKKCRPPKPTSDSAPIEFGFDNCNYSSEEKVREYELQILFRMEIITLLHGTSEDNQHVRSLVSDICALLESIQFNLPGGVLEGESLLDFSNTVIKERYNVRLPSVVEEIYTTMEFNGHDDDSEVEEFETLKSASEVAPSETAPSVSDAQSVGVDDESFSNSDNLQDAGSHEKKKSHRTKDAPMQKALFRDKSRYRNVDTGDYELKKAQANRERAKRFSHFASSSRDLLKVTVVPKVTVNIKKSTKMTSRDKSQKSRKDVDKEVILQTPLSTRSKSHRYKRENDREVILQTPLSTRGNSQKSKRDTDRDVIQQTPQSTRGKSHRSAVDSDKDVIQQTPFSTMKTRASQTSTSVKKSLFDT